MDFFAHPILIANKLEAPRLIIAKFTSPPGPWPPHLANIKLFFPNCGSTRRRVPGHGGGSGHGGKYSTLESVRSGGLVLDYLPAGASDIILNPYRLGPLARAAVGY